MVCKTNQPSIYLSSIFNEVIKKEKEREKKSTYSNACHVMKTLKKEKKLKLSDSVCPIYLTNYLSFFLSVSH